MNPALPNAALLNAANATEQAAGSSVPPEIGIMMGVFGLIIFLVCWLKK
jgi:tetrahydromethanopterin S-methyltransferase subunit G